MACINGSPAHPNMLEAYEARQKWQRDYVTNMSAAKRSGIEEGKKEGKKEGRQEGEIAGITTSILIALRTKGSLSPALEERIKTQKDLDVLKSWLNLALRAGSIGEFSEQLDS